MQCKICIEDIDYIIMYRTKDGSLKPFDYCIDCLQLQLFKMWDDYFIKLKTIDCEVGLKRLLLLGPPFYFRDYCIEDNIELHEFHYNNTIISAKNKNSIDDSFKDELTIELNNLSLDVFYDFNLQTILNKFNIK